jgi:hypothetical protein
LPRESQYTTAAAAWADNEVCKLIIARMQHELPSISLRIGAATIPETRVKFGSLGNVRVQHQIEALATKFVRLAIVRVQEQIDQLKKRSQGSWICRSLNVEESSQDDAVQEFRLTLEGLWPCQCDALEGRGWTIRDGSAEITLPPDAYEREIDWLRGNKLI